MRAEMEEMWARFEPFADPAFRQSFSRDVESHFWEMLLGCRLLNAGCQLTGHELRRHANGCPDICVVGEGRRVWIEAIAPTRGDDNNADRVAELVPLNEGGGFQALPEREILLRISGAFFNKQARVARYIEDGIIEQDAPRLIAISGANFGAMANGGPVPLALKALFPLGDEVLVLDEVSGEVIRHEIREAWQIERLNRDPIQRNAFLDPQFAHISGVIWTCAGTPNWDERRRPFVLIHNPLAAVPLDERLMPFDQEYRANRVDGGWQIERVGEA
ncbi:MAG: hypothetical protein ACXIVO_10860 [Glycocaulis sp.]